MAAPMKTLVDDKPPKQWAPKYSDHDPIQEHIVMQKIRRCISELEGMFFYPRLRDRLQTQPVSEHLQKVLGSESKMEMVIYGIGKIELYENPRVQLSLAISMKRDFEWIGDIKVFDPLLSATECKILEALGCSVLSVNEDGKRKALKPTMFFMPYCPVHLLENLLQANWTLDLLGNIVLFGNRLKTMNFHHMNHISSAKKFTLEFLTRGHHAFCEFSWQFFHPIAETELQIMNDCALNEGRVEKENCDYALNRDIAEIERSKSSHEVEILKQTPEELEHLKNFYVQKLKRCMEDFQSSQFYLGFRDKLQNPLIFEFLPKVLESKSMQIVIYGIGDILVENVMLNISLAILMKKDFKWIENIEVFGCNLSTTACQVLETFGCSVLPLEEHRFRQTLKPTIFFMQDCSLELYNILLTANWKPDLLQNMVVLCGIQLKDTKDIVDLYYDCNPVLRNTASKHFGYVLAAQKITNEFKFKTIFYDHYTFQDSSCWEDYYDAFYHTTWHFFGLAAETELQRMHEVIQKGDIV